jgi:hypothetical protein
LAACNPSQTLDKSAWSFSSAERLLGENPVEPHDRPVENPARGSRDTPRQEGQLSRGLGERALQEGQLSAQPPGPVVKSLRQGPASVVPERNASRREGRKDKKFEGKS